MKTKILICLIILLSTNLLSQVIDENLKKSVAFIFQEYPRGELSPLGTAFLVSISREVENDSVVGAYFVTAKHVLKHKYGFYSKIFIRINKKEGGSDTLRFDLFDSNNNRKFLVHPDSTVDLVVIPGMLDFDKYDVVYLPEEMILTKEILDKNNIHEGDDVFFVGLFHQYYGSKSNLPISRFGRISLMTDEKILWNKIPMDLYLIETTTYGGNSGSPLFIHLGHTRHQYLNLSPTKIYLGGVIQGYFNEFSDLQTVTSPIPKIVSKENSGIAAIIPAEKIIKLIEDMIEYEISEKKLN